MTAPMSTRRTLVLLAAAAAVSIAAPATTAHGQSAAPKATNIAVTTPGEVQGLTADQCKIFAHHFTGFVKDAGRENLSDEFINAVREFVIKRKCSAPASIPVNAKELAIFNALSGIMYDNHRVKIKEMGIVPVLRTAALQ